MSSPLHQRLHQPWVDQKSLAFCRYLAEVEFPGDDPDEAFNKYVADRKTDLPIYFLNKEGQRCLWSKDVDHFEKKNSKRNGRSTQKIVVRGDLYYLRNEAITLKEVDEPKSAFIKSFVTHPSEPGWNLALSHDRHFSKFPQEIQDRIFQHVLTVPSPTEIEPSVITSNWNRAWRVQDYQAIPASSSEVLWTYPSAYAAFIASIPRCDTKGEYFELRIVNLAAIDASVLRTNKTVYENNNRWLYGKNIFHFKMLNPSRIASPPSLLPETGVHKPPILKPVSQRWDATILGTLINLIEDQVPLKSLPGWIYYDPFLRFLHTIGPKNAAMITTLTFVGTAKLHLCRGLCRDPCEWGLISSLEIYIPFIKYFCKNLEKLVLQVYKDYIFLAALQRRPLAPDHPVTTEQAMKPLLQGAIRSIESLKELVVVGSKPEIDFAEEAVLWFRDRTRERDRVEREKQGLDARVEVEKKLDQKLRLELGKPNTSALEI